jgi:GNAT superfamily N-acetyltransferase
MSIACCSRGPVGRATNEPAAMTRATGPWLQPAGQSPIESTNMTNFTIRPATETDLPVILQLIRDLAEYEREPEAVVATEESLREVLFGSKPAAEVLLALEEEHAVGFAVFFHNFSTWLGRPGLYLEDLFVRPSERGKGYGRALLERLAQIAHERGCGRMEWAVLDWNEPAIQFYKKLGAQPMTEWTVFRLTRDEIARLAGRGKESKN